jgi:3-polyprenyl-4-hydroxybenzoate decarboxylase
MGIDATVKWPEEGLRREWPKRLVTTEAAARKADALWEKIRKP